MISLCLLVVILAGVIVYALVNRDRWECMHHEPTGRTWVHSQLVNLGANKLYRCAECGKTWYV